MDLVVPSGGCWPSRDVDIGRVATICCTRLDYAGRLGHKGGIVKWIPLKASFTTRATVPKEGDDTPVRGAQLALGVLSQHIVED